MRRAFSLAETLVMLAVGCTVLATVMTLWSSAHHYSAALEERFTLLSRAQVALSTMTRDVQFAKRIAHPAAGDIESGLAVLDSQGELVQIALVRPSPDRPGTLVRRRLGAQSTGTLILTGVLDARFRVPPVPRGRDPDLVHITLTLAGPQGKPIHLIASARVRAPVPACPIER